MIKEVPYDMHFLLSRSTQLFVISRCIGRHCRKKEPIPKEKVYSERTVEMGVFIDRHLYQKMSVSQLLFYLDNFQGPLFRKISRVLTMKG